MPIEKSPRKISDTELQQSPSKKRKITAAQKQALVENLQLEIAERARKLRSNYNIHAQSLRTRIEIRVNRIPMSLRRMKMEDLLQRYSSDTQSSTSSANTTAKPQQRGPPVPEKDRSPERPVTSRPVYQIAPPPAARPKRRSHEMAGGDKENAVESTVENPKKRPRANPISHSTNQHILSPTSSNMRAVPQRQPNPAMTPGANRTGTGIARPTPGPVSPTKGTNAATSLLHSVVRNTAPRPTILPGSVRKIPSSSAISAANPPPSARKRGATVGGQPTPAAASRPGTRTATARRVSGTSESSEGSTSTVVRNRPATAPGDRPPPPKAAATSTMTAKKVGAGVVNSLKKGVAGTTGTATAGKKTAAAAAAAGGSVGRAAGRVLRKRV
ncbi:Borealin N terminal-domain-containing protein [Cladorrhinum samala]|uniref:Borealin N terminal-domain-containing protein n=1 Tax=Cladorrhinum samala TaxID=585594 RepID=A0AAV9HF47_9PEZI|nr:Borealin N terminal-domain-containing protein [Cladorrhinum samala]